MENLSEYIYEIVAVVILCLGLGVFYNISTSATTASTNVTQETRNKTNVKEGDYGYTGSNIVPASSVYCDIVANNGETAIIIHDASGRDTEVAKADIENAQLKNDASYITKYLNMSGNYLKEYVNASNGQATIVRYTEQT